jgi:hypothetical protein
MMVEGNGPAMSGCERVAHDARGAGPAPISSARRARACARLEGVSR